MTFDIYYEYCHIIRQINNRDGKTMESVYDKKDLCCGCTACKMICPTEAIKMIADYEGFLYPEIDQELCIDCGLCLETCAFQKGYDKSANYKTPIVYALKHRSDLVREKSSSGGAFTAISDYILSSNGIIYGAILDEDMKVSHQRGETEEERDEFRGSKYVQSELNDIYLQIKNDLKQDKLVLFTGTPCQVAGLKKFLTKSKLSIDKVNKLILVDFICHGTSSPIIFKDYIKYQEKKNKSRVINYLFRSKVKGWRHTEEVFFENGKKDSKSELSKLHKSIYHSKLTMRPSCHTCIYTNKKRPSDMTIGDFWGLANYLPEFKDRLGVSVILINTDKGSDLYTNISDATESILSNIKDCSKKQGNLRRPTKVNPEREEFWAYYNKKGFRRAMKKYLEYKPESKVKKLWNR